MRFADFLKTIDDEKRGMSSFADQSEKNKTLDRILEITKTINRSLILDEVLNLVLKNAIEITSSDRGFILLKEKDGRLRFTVGADSNDSPISEPAFNISTSVVEEVFKTGLSRYIEGAQSDTNRDPSKSIFILDLQTILCAPLITGDEKIGVIYVDSKALHRIKVNEIISTFEILAGQAAIAIRNAQLFKQQIDANNELIRLNKELDDARILAEKSSMFKSSLLSNMSHEIRTPMNGILGLSSYLKDTVQDKDHSKLLEKVVDSAKRLMKTLTAMLDLSELESHNIRENLCSLSVAVKLREIAKHFQKSADEKKLKIYLQIKSEFNVLFDDKYFTLMLESLIENAIKFTKQGNVTVSCYQEYENGVIQISDTGIGIDPVMQRIIFDAFRQASEGWSRTYEGSGLGLAIVKKISEIYNGRIVLESEPGKGSTFRIILPVEKTF